MKIEQLLTTSAIYEESPNTLEGSFTPDLVESKVWLVKILAKILKDKSAGNIYVLGSWFGNIGVFLQQEQIRFDKLILVDLNKEWLLQSGRLLRPLYDLGKLRLLNKDAGDVHISTPAVVINTSANEMKQDWFDRVPAGSIVAIQARDNAEGHEIPINDIDQLDALFPMRHTFYLNQRRLRDPETKYTRYMKVGIK